MFIATLFIIAEGTVVRPNHETLSSNMTPHVNLHRKRDFAGGSKFANQLFQIVLDYSGGLSGITESLEGERETEENVRAIGLYKTIVRERKTCRL